MLTFGYFSCSLCKIPLSHTWLTRQPDGCRINTLSQPFPIYCTTSAAISQPSAVLQPYWMIPAHFFFNSSKESSVSNLPCSYPVRLRLRRFVRFYLLIEAHNPIPITYRRNRRQQKPWGNLETGFTLPCFQVFQKLRNNEHCGIAIVIADISQRLCLIFYGIV